MVQKAALVILDGWGIGKHDAGDAVWKAKTPFTDMLWDNYPHCQLRTDGENVGLPEGQMGNSEVGHMNIGAGRVVWQMLVRINKAFAEGSIEENPILREIFSKAAEGNRCLHLVGLVSDGGVHSHQQHLIGLCKLASKFGLSRVYIHAFLDGRDTDPKSGAGYIENVLHAIDGTGVKISTVVGRYYAMDRDKRWERVARAWQLMVKGNGLPTANVIDGILKQYENDITDEFMEPLRCLPGQEGLIADDDVVLCFNYRTDRGRQITQALTQQDFSEVAMHKLNLHYYTFTEYDETFDIAGVVFDKQNLTNTLGEVVSRAGLTQLRAAETEKYPHVTFFFSGGREEPFEGETRLMVNSPKVATYDLQPEMSAVELSDRAIKLIEKDGPDLLVLNFANPDMVGHTGVFPAIVKAVETVDECLSRLVTTGLQNGYEYLIIADHGNADFAINEDGSPNTAHSTNPVPCWFVSKDRNPNLKNGILADVAPTILKIMNLNISQEMSGRPLF
jgi:2,3-bisphosphoglycerate-independent phosphoglycerate mutase